MVTFLDNNDKINIDNSIAEARDQFDIKSAEGSAIVLNDSADFSFMDMKIYGKTEQFTTTGKNLLENVNGSGTAKGITYTVNNDGSITCTGTSTESNSFKNINNKGNTVCAIPPGDYIVSGGKDGVRIQVLVDDISIAVSEKNNEARFTVPETATSSWVRTAVPNVGTTVNTTVYPMIRLASITDPTYEPYTGGKPSPSPEYRQELESIGKWGNLLDLSDSKVESTATKVMNEDGSATVTNNTGAATAGLYKVLTGLLPKGTYTFRNWLGTTAYVMFSSSDYTYSVSSNGGNYTFDYDGKSYLKIQYADIGANNTVTFKAQITYAKDNITSYRPYTGQKEIEAGVYGGNLLKYESFYATNVNVRFSKYDDIITVIGSTSYAAINNSFLKHKGRELYFYYESKTQTNIEAITTIQLVIRENEKIKYISIHAGEINRIAIPYNATSVTLQIYVNNSGTVLDSENEVKVKGLKVTYAENIPWTPYTEQSHINSVGDGLKGIPVTKSSHATHTDENGQMWCSDVKDYAKNVNKQNIKRLVLDGTENWVKYGTDQYGLSNSDTGALPSSRALCSHYPYSYYSEINSFFIGTSGIAFVTEFETLEEFKAFLAEQYANGTPVTVDYILAEPIVTPLSAEEIASYKSLHANNPVTTIINDCNAYTKVDYINEKYDTGVKDVIEKIINPIEDTLNNKMLKDNPTGTGSFSLNRMPDSQIGYGSVAEGVKSTASGDCSHAEGNFTEASGYASHAEGQHTVASGMNSHAEGATTKGTGDYSHAEGNNTTAFGDYSHAEGIQTYAYGAYSHAEGRETEAGKVDDTSIIAAHAEGFMTKAIGNVSHAEGFATTASGMYSHAEGDNTVASGEHSHAEGGGTSAIGHRSHAEGSETTAYGVFSHAEGDSSISKGNYSHAEGGGTTTDAIAAHAEGSNTTASGHSSHAEGYCTTAAGRYQHVQGSYNITDTENKYLHIVGNGDKNNETPSNAHTLDWDGNAWYAGTIKIGGTSYSDANEVALKSDIPEIPEMPDLSDYMSSNNPTGTGSFSLNRKANTSIGINSFTAGFNSTASGMYSHAVGFMATASGAFSHAEGQGATASSDNSHAEGYYATASGESSHAEGRGTQASGANSHTEGSGTTAGGYASHAEGLSSTASGDYSHAEGMNTKALGGMDEEHATYIEATHAEGKETTASGDASHAEGAYTTASNYYTHAEGFYTTASGMNSHAEGSGTTASGDGSHAEGNCTVALSEQHAQGHYNNTITATAGSSSGTTGTAFVIGNGTSASATSNAFRVQYDGAVYAKAAYNASGADYAEYFEWFDGNPLNEDRRGYFVTLYGNKITIADKYDYVLGIVSGQPSVIGNSDEEWMGRYITDEFGAFIMEEFEYEVTKSNKTVEIKKGMRYKENPNYDNSLPYVQRADRPEWSAVGMLGVLAVRDDGTCKVNGFAEVADGGIATAAEGGYRVIERVSDNVVKIIFK